MPSVLRPHFLPKILATFSRLLPPVFQRAAGNAHQRRDIRDGRHRGLVKPLAFGDEFGRDLDFGRCQPTPE